MALVIGAFVGGPSGFDLIDTDEYWREISSSVLERREACASGFQPAPPLAPLQLPLLCSLLTVSRSNHSQGSHLLKWAPLVNAYRAVGFMASTILISQVTDTLPLSSSYFLPLTSRPPPSSSRRLARAGASALSLGTCR